MPELKYPFEIMEKEYSEPFSEFQLQVFKELDEKFGLVEATMHDIYYDVMFQPNYVVLILGDKDFQILYTSDILPTVKRRYKELCKKFGDQIPYVAGHKIRMITHFTKTDEDLMDLCQIYKTDPSFVKEWLEEIVQEKMPLRKANVIIKNYVKKIPIL